MAKKNKDKKDRKKKREKVADSPPMVEFEAIVPPTHEELALGTWLKVIRAAESLKSDLAGGLAAHKLTLGQFGVLEALLHCGPLCQRDLAAKLQVSGGNMTTVIDNLERRSLARRVRNERDRRYVSVHLTEEGESLIRRVYPEQAERIVELMGHLSDKRLERLGRAARDLGLHVSTVPRP